MKVEVINENRIQITLTLDELNKRNLSLRDIENDAKKAKKFFLDLIEESNLQDEFSLEHTQVFVEATTDCNNEFVVTITKLDNFPDISKFDILNNSNLTKESSYLEYYSNFSIFEFTSLDVIIDLSKMLKSNKCYIGKNSLYTYNDKYFLIFGNYTIKNAKFLKTVSIINEYCDNMYEGGIFETSLKEKSKELIKDRALQKVHKI